MLNCIRTVGFRFKALAATAAFLTISGANQAQTAPQLLPYTSKLIAGGGTQSIAKGATCPSSGYTSTDAYGDGCLATEIMLTSMGATTTKPYGAHYAAADASGAVYFSDATAGLIRRVDPITGIVTAYAGGATSSPSAGSTCGAYVSTDSRGDGCLSTAVHLTYPMGVSIASNGDLLFTDVGQYDVRRIAAVGGVLPATGGIISNVAGYTAGGATFGYAASNATTTINAATQSYLDAPYNVAFDSKGDILVAEEFKNAILAINPGTAANIVSGVSIAPGSIVKIAGTSTASGYTGTIYCPNGTATPFGCNFGTYTEGASANLSLLDNSYAVAVDPNGVVYLSNEYNNVISKVSTSGIMTSYAGVQGKAAKTTTRGVAPFAMGSSFGIVSDPYSNLYITDAVAGVVWRVDAAGQYQYVVAGGASSPCSTAVDSYGDGCPATQSTFGATGTAFATAASPGIFGVTQDTAGNLYLGDTVTNLVREISSNTQFGQVGSALTQTLDIHFAAGDTPAANAYTLTQTNANFTLGSATCTSNSDTTTDCLLPVTAMVATSANLGAFSAMLTVNSTRGGTNTFTLTGTHVQTPVTRTTVSVAASSNCTGTTTFAAGTAVTLTATIVSTGAPSGTVQFYANNAPVSTPVTVSGGTAQLKYTFPSTGTYTISATYSGDSYFTTSSGNSGNTITLTTPSLGTTMVESPINGTIVQGQTATYSFNLAQTVYTGTLTFSVSGLPANSTATFSPSSISATGCTTSSTVALTISTSLAQVKQSGLTGGSGPWRMGVLFTSLVLAGVLALRRRSLSGNWPRLMMMLALLVASSSLIACGKSAQTGVSTPAGSYPLVVKATGSDGTSTTLNTTLIINAYQDPYK